MAFDYFVEQQVDIAIIEVGLGGRIDSTNIITPELSIITNISYDHMYLLGNTLQEIATEKAGIIKPYVPVVIGETVTETKPVFKKQAGEMDAPLVFAQEQRWVADYAYDKELLKVVVANHHNNERETYIMDLGGLYQGKNLLAVLEAVHILKQKGWHIEPAIVHKALENVKRLTGFHGRWEVLHRASMLC